MVPVVAQHLQGLGVGAAGAEWQIAGIVSGQLSSVSLPGDRCPCPLHHQEGLELERRCWVPAESCCGPARCQGGLHQALGPHQNPQADTMELMTPQFSILFIYLSCMNVTHGVLRGIKPSQALATCIHSLPHLPWANPQPGAPPPPQAPSGARAPSFCCPALQG